MGTRTFILGTAGHIDHGKTTLVRALTGIDTDRLPEEKSRGITIDIGFANLQLGDLRIGIVDVPGHERFIRNMLAGAAGIDLAMLIIAADDGVMPQTREHLAILQLLGIRRGVIALTKIDLAEESWIDLVEEDVRDLMRSTFLEDAPIVRVAAQKGEGIEQLRAAIADTCEEVAATASVRPDGTPDVPDPESKAGAQPFRLAVDRSFHAAGVGTIITGSVASGTLHVSDEVEWLPAGKRVRVRGLQSHGADVESVSRGQRAAINLIGVHHSEIVRGHELASPGWLRPSRILTVHLRLLGDSPLPVRHRARVRLHIGTQEHIASVRLLGGSSLEPGESSFAQFFCAAPVVAYAQEPFVVRAESPLVTLGGGHILQPAARPIRRRDAADVLPHLEGLRSSDPAARAADAIYFFGARPWTDFDLARDAAIEPHTLPAILDRLVREGTVIALGAAQGPPAHVHREALAGLEARMAAATARAHEEAPLEPSIPRQRVTQRLARVADAAILASVIDRMIAAKRLRGDAHTVALPSFKPQLSSAQQDLLARMIEIYDRAEFAPPDVGEMARDVRASEKEVRTILDLAVKAGKVAHLGGPLYMHTRHEAELRQRARDTLRQRGALAMSDFRDTFATTRKYAVPMAEYLDRIGLTRRQGDVRVLREDAE